MGAEGGGGGVPAEGADAELDDGEAAGGVPELEVADVGAVELEGVPPGRGRHARHLQIHRHEVRFPHPRPEPFQSLREVPPRHLLHRRAAPASPRLAGGDGARRA